MIVSPELAELRAAGSDLLREQEGDAAFIARSRLYAILQRADNIRPDVRVIAQDKLWAVVRVARHGTPESETQFAQTVLACLAARRDVAPQREKTQLLSAGSAARKGLAINDEVTRKGKTYFTWDKKRRLLDRDLNIFVSYTPTAPYLTAKKLRAAERESLVRKGELRKRRQERAPAVLDRVLELLEAGTGVREISRITGVPKSTVSDLKKRFHPQGV